MQVYDARLRDDAELGRLADALRRAGCATRPDGPELEVFVPNDQLEDSDDADTVAHVELTFLLRALAEADDAEASGAQIVEEGLTTIPDDVFDAYRTNTGGDADEDLNLHGVAPTRT